MREVCFLISHAGAILHADASDDPVALPDTRSRWEAIWAHRDELAIIAHSHPVGPARFSREDQTTMEALDSALGRPVRYMVVAPRITIVCDGHAGETTQVSPEPWWAGLLRLASNMKVRKADTQWHS